jgi:hypothetical protein
MKQGSASHEQSFSEANTRLELLQLRLERLQTEIKHINEETERATQRMVMCKTNVKGLTDCVLHLIESSEMNRDNADAIIQLGQKMCAEFDKMPTNLKQLEEERTLIKQRLLQTSREVDAAIKG